MNETPRTGGEDRRAMDEARFEALLARALEVDVPPAPQRAAPAAAPARRSRLPRWAGLAAGAAGVGLLVLLQFRPPAPTGSLPGDVVAHIHHEPGALARTGAAVSSGRFDEVMRAAGVAMAPPVGTVSYVKLCPFRGEMVAHFVLQGRAGPITVLLLPDEEVAEPVPVDEDGFRGTIAPLAVGGSIAIVGEPGEDLKEIQTRIADAVRWRL